MVRIISLLSAAALLSSSVIAAPIKRQNADVEGCGDGCNPEPPMPEPPMPEPPMPEPQMPEEPPKCMEGDEGCDMPEPPMPEPPMPEPPSCMEGDEGCEPPMPEPPMPEEPPKCMEGDEGCEPPMPEPPMPEEPPKCMEGDEGCEPPMPEPPMPEPPSCMEGDEGCEPPMPEPPMPEPPSCMEGDEGCEPPMPEPPMPEPPSCMEGDEGCDMPPPPPPPMPPYGSGHSNWGYEDCVSKCMAQYPPTPPTEYTPPENQETTMPDGGKVHYVYVAPVDGVPRYTPWALNATVGDTVRFVWTGTVEHSVTMGSELNMCNKSEAADTFDSGLMTGEDGEKTFDVKVESEDTKYFYCSKGDHCSKGMWGMINPKAAPGSDLSIGSLMPQWAAANPDIQAALNVTSTDDEAAMNWGNSISLEGVPEDQYVNVAYNVLYTRATLAGNQGMQDSGLGAVNPDGSPIQFPGDIAALIAESNTPSTGGSEAPANAAESTPPPAESEAADDKSSASVTTVSAAMSVFALLAAVFVL